MSVAKQIDRLVKMANQIALNTGARFDADRAALRTAEHIRKFWTPAMRGQLTDHWRAGGDGLEPVVVSALDALSNGK
jgi:formate dehydrogenase subunit delta